MWVEKLGPLHTVPQTAFPRAPGKGLRPCTPIPEIISCFCTKLADRHPGLLDAAAFAWYGVQPPNVVVKHDGRIFRNLNQYRLPGVRLPSRSCRTDVACVIAADLLTQIAWMSCVVLPSIVPKSIDSYEQFTRQAVMGELQRPLHPQNYGVLLFG